MGSGQSVGDSQGRCYRTGQIPALSVEQMLTEALSGGALLLGLGWSWDMADRGLHFWGHR